MLGISEKTFAYIFALFFALQSCAQQANDNLSPQMFLDKVVHEENAQLVDVRTRQEYEKGHLVDARNYDIHAPYFKDSVLTLDKSRPVYVYCLAGSRSEEAAKILKKEGFTKVYNLQGGINAWSQQKLPLAEDVRSGSQDKLSIADFEILLKKYENGIIIDFYAPWCTPCKKMEPAIARLNVEFGDKLPIYRINIDEAQALSEKLGITAIPLFHYYKKGALVKQMQGYQSEEALRAFMTP